MKKTSHSKTVKRISYPPFTKAKFFGKEGSKCKIPRFIMGQTRPYTHEVTLLCLKEGNVPEQVLESLRVSVNYQMQKVPEGYLMKLFPFPHNFVRKHGLLGVAKAERLMKGMRHSYGKVSDDRVARVKPNQVILKLWCMEKDLELAKKSMHIADTKFPFPCRIIVSRANNVPVVKDRAYKEEMKPVPSQPTPFQTPTQQEGKQGKSPMPKVEKKGRVR